MAKEVITRFKLETTAFDSKIKQASKELSDYSKTATQAKEGFNQFTKANVDAAKALGTMATSSTNLKGKLQELVGAYNEGVKAYKAMSDEQKQSDWAKALAGSLTQLQQRIKETKAEMQGLGNEIKNSGIFGGDKLSGMLQVFGGNLMTKAAGFAAGAVAEMGDLVKQSIEVAKSAEGIRLAYNRLNRPNLMATLKEQTHGVVSELELMKAAVKFNDFRLPVEELGTMLAFAQQKAKDTGQSVDYMVDSIVTGLGRKSLMILDNLGLSAAEIKEKMAETGDMTKAVGQIIREQMQKAGDYTETAADRAAKATADVQDKMLELGTKLQPLADEGASMWNSLKLGGLSLITSVLDPLIAKYTHLGQLMQQYGNLGGGGKVQGMLAMLGNGGARAQSTYQQQQSQFWRYINPREEYLNNLRRWRSGERSEGLQKAISQGRERFGVDDRAIQAQVDAAKKMLREYQDGAQKILNPVGDSSNNKAIKGIGDLKKKLKELEDQRKKAVLAGDNDLVDSLTKQINSVKQNIGYLDPNTLKTSSKTEKTEIQKNEDQIKKLSLEYAKLGDVETEASRKRQEEIKKEIELLQQRNGLLGLRAEQAQGRLLGYAGDFDKNTKNVGGVGMLDQTTNFGKNIAIPRGGLLLSDKVMKSVNKNLNKQLKNEEKKEDVSAMTGIGQMVDGITTMTGALQQLGVEVPEGINKMFGAMQDIITIVSAIQAMQQVGTWLGIFHNGGIVPHAANGYYVPGNRYSGDTTPIMANAGELVLNKSQQYNLASQLSGNSFENLNLTATIRGEQIRLALNNNGRRTGRGEYVQTNRR